MAKKKTEQSGLSNEQKLGIGVGLTAAAAAAVGSYFLYGSKNADENRKKVKSWMLKAKADVLEGLERAQEMSREEYEELVNTIGEAYADVQNASKKDIKEFKEEMKAHWDTIEQHAKPIKKSTKKAVGTTAKTAKKTTSKATSKAKSATKKATTGTKKTARQTTKK